MAERSIRWEIVAYVGLFLAGLVLFAVLRVPSDRLARVAVAYAENAGYRIDYTAVGATLLPGFSLEGVRVFNQNTEAKLPLAELDRISVRTLVLPLVLGKAGVAIEGEGYGGGLDATVTRRGESNWLSGELSGVDLSAVEGLQRKLQVPLKGVVDARFDFELLSSLQQHVGTADVVVDNLRLEEGDLMGAFRIPPVDFGDVHGAVLLENGKLIFDRFASDGQDVKLAVDGSVALAQPFTRSGLDLSLELGLSQRVEESVGMFMPMLRMTKNPQGRYIRKVGGTISSPR